MNNFLLFFTNHNIEIPAPNNLDKKMINKPNYKPTNQNISLSNAKRVSDYSALHLRLNPHYAWTSDTARRQVVQKLMFA